MTKKKMLLTLTAILSGTVLAQAIKDRELKVEGAPRGDLQKGPWTYVGNPVKASVSTLNLQASQVVVSIPAGTTLATSKGKKTGTFTGNVSVNRGRLSAKGEKLDYSEVTGQGVLTGNASANFVPEKKEDGDAVSIKAAQMSLDVDNNVSTSTGNVQLVQGNQTGKADKLVFDEDRELAQLTGNPTLTRAAKGNQKELVINGKEVRALTKNKTLYVTGGVKLVQGTLTTTGDSVYYDDKLNVAYVVGKAMSVDSKTGDTVKGTTLKQLTDRGRVNQYSGTYKIPTEQFKLRGEK